MIVRFTRRAEADLVAIQDYLERRSPEGARRVAASLLQTIEVVANHPQSGASTRRPHVFVKIVPNYPYKIFYRVSERSIDILHVFGIPRGGPGLCKPAASQGNRSTPSGRRLETTGSSRQPRPARASRGRPRRLL